MPAASSVLVLSAVFVIGWAGCVSAAAGESAGTENSVAVDYVQAWLGAVDSDDGWTLERPGQGDDLVGGLGTLPLGGGAAQRLWGQGIFRLGYEGGGLVSWKNQNTEFFVASGSGGGTLAISTENTFLSVGVFMGGLASLQLTEQLRLQLAAGPSLTWARLTSDGLQADSDAGADHTGQDVSLVPYGRLGVELLLSDRFMIGASVRYADDEFDFGDSGELDVDEVVWLLTLGSRL